MALFAEVWTRPGHASFGRVIADPPNDTLSFHDGVGVIGDGRLSMPSSFDRFDDILYIDPVNTANCVSSLVRIYDDVTDPPTLVFEWRPSAIAPAQSKRDFKVAVTGRGIKGVLGDARTEAWDWDGSAQWACSVCDWLWGGPNLLADWDFENPQITPTTYELVIVATGGDYTLSDGIDTTAPIAFNAPAGTVQTRIEADIASLPDVIVADVGLNPITKLITYFDPPFGPNLTVDGSGLTGPDAAATLAVTQEGGMSPSGWQKASVLAAGIPQNIGGYTTFEVSADQNHTPGGQFSLKIDPGPNSATGNRWLGTQQVVAVTPGQLYQASVWIYPVSATDTYRLAIMTVGEEFVASTPWPGITLTPNDWNELAISDVTIPSGVDRVIFRVQNTVPGPSDPALFYVDDAELNEGQAPSTVGAILTQLYDDATSDHPGRVVWEDEANPGTPYLTPDFTDLVDSNGDPWDRSDISIRIWMRMTYLQVMETFAQTYGYEWRIVPDDPDAGTWLWQVFNPGGMATDYTTATNPAIQGGASDTRRGVQRFLPTGTQVMVEGLERLTGRAADAGLVSALGRIETSRIDKELPEPDVVTDAAQTDVANLLQGGVQYPYVLTDPTDRPGVAYILGDILTIHDPPLVDAPGRLADLEVSKSPEQTDYEVTFVPPEEPTSP